MSKTLLVVDDAAVNRKIFIATLKGEYDILEAENGAVAMEIIWREREKLAAVLLDVLMPVMDGYEVLRRMRDSVELARIPVVVITGSEDEASRVKALSLGANDFITKPYHPDIIRHCLKNNIALREAASFINAIQRDRLTGLFTREAFFLKAEALIRAGEPGRYVMSCFDVNNFKLINDQYGTAEGDRILQSIGHAVRAQMEDVGGVGARISGDNFAVLFPVSCAGRDFVAEFLRGDAAPAALSASTALSVGRYVVTDTLLAASAIYDRAYIAKQSIKGRYDARLAYFDEAMLKKLIDEQQIIADMDAAIREKQFEVWFQPQYNHYTGALVGAEALARWRHPQRGLIPPGLFIPVFEQNGFVYELDKYVWEEACRYLRQWMDEGLAPPPVSVNISRYDIFCPDLTDVICGLIRKYDIPADMLRLEITESAFAKSTRQIVGIVGGLIARGFTLEIDDFGSGYSSLNTLKSVPAQVVKLDMRFLEGDDDSQRGGSILESIVRMARWLGMSVIAEGVETVEQADYLKSIGCHYVQGYLYARPMPAPQYALTAIGARKEDRLTTMQAVKSLNNAFWDPNSMDTLIFNSYVGGACILEYGAGKIELLRANDQFLRMLDTSDDAPERVLGINFLEHLSPNSRARAENALRLSIASKEDVPDEYVLSGLPDRPGEICLRCTMRVIASADGRYLVYCRSEDITSQRLAEQKERENDALLRFLNEIAHGILAQPDAQAALAQLLEKLLAYFGGRRAYIFELDEARGPAKNTYEVCAPGADSEKARRPEISWDTVAPLLAMFEARGHLRADRTEAAQAESAARAALAARGIESAVAVPIKRDGRVIGFAGIDDPKQHHPSMEHLAALGDYIAVALTRRDLQAKIDSDNRALAALMNDTPGGIANYECAPGAIRITHYNDGYCRLFGYTREEYECVSARDPLVCVRKEDAAMLLEQLDALLKEDKPIDCVYRARTKDGADKWINLKAVATDRHGGAATVNAVLLDVTQRQLALERLRISEEENRLAMLHTGNTIARYFVCDMSLTFSREPNPAFRLPRRMEDVPYAPVRRGEISPETADAYTAFFEGILNGLKTGAVTYQRMSKQGWRWLKARYTTIFSDAGQPVSAVISFTDVTEQVEKETVFKKWQQSLRDRAPETYTLFRCNISKNTAFDSQQGSLLSFEREDEFLSFDEHTAIYVSRRVFEDDRPRYAAFLNSDSLLASYYRGKRANRIEYRENTPYGVRWLRLTVDLVEHPNSTDVEAYMMYENIDARKKEELLTLQKAQTDDLTGVLNRATFASRVERLIRDGRPGACHAMLMLDIDGFKLVNDVFGHGAGDQVLIDIVSALRAVLRKDDLLGRLGGDEFVVFLRDIPDDSIAEKKARQICSLARRPFDQNVRISASVGIAICPRDGTDFPTLYQKMDAAMYHVKALGKDGVAFYRENM